MPKAGTQDDNVFGAIEQTEVKRGRQDDGTYITSTGEVLPAKNRNKREPYAEPEESQVDGHEELVQTPDGSLSFIASRMTQAEFAKSGYTERKRQKCLYRIVEVYSGQPRKTYSYDELEQLRRGELKR